MSLSVGPFGPDQSPALLNHVSDAHARHHIWMREQLPWLTRQELHDSDVMAGDPGPFAALAARQAYVEARRQSDVRITGCVVDFGSTHVVARINLVNGQLYVRQSDRLVEFKVTGLAHIRFTGLTTDVPVDFPYAKIAAGRIRDLALYRVQTCSLLKHLQDLAAVPALHRVSLCAPRAQVS